MDIFRVIEAPFSHTNGTAEKRWHFGSAAQGFRIVVTEIPPGHVQNEHRHERLLDIIYVLEGQIQVYQRRDGELREETLQAGDIVCFEPPEFHNVANKSAALARTMTLKMTRDSTILPEALDHLFDSDWIGYNSE
jgi:quercetin dioxygenase-like cupin family protein